MIGATMGLYRVALVCGTLAVIANACNSDSDSPRTPPLYGGPGISDGEGPGGEFSTGAHPSGGSTHLGGMGHGGANAGEANGGTDSPTSGNGSGGETQRGEGGEATVGAAGANDSGTPCVLDISMLPCTLG